MFGLSCHFPSEEVFVDNTALWKQIGLSMSIAQRKPLIAAYGVAHVQIMLMTLLLQNSSSVVLNEDIIRRIARELDDNKPESISVIEGRRLAFSVLSVMMDGRQIRMDEELLSRFIIATNLLATALAFSDFEEKMSFLKAQIQPF